jgi:hypothetical protein
MLRSLRCPRRRLFRRHPAFVVATAGLAALEALLVVTVGPAGAAPLAPQVSAPGPFGVFHDLRWLLVYHPSWWVFVVGGIALLGGRAALDAALVRAAWPPEHPKPAWRAQLAHSLRFTTITAAALLLFAVLDFAMAVTSLSWLFFVAVPVLVMVAVLVHHGEVVPSWWRDAPTRVSVVSTLAVFALLTVGGAVISALPAAAVPVGAAVIALAVAACRLRSVDALVARASAPVRAEGRRRRRPFAVLGLAGVLAIVVGGTAVGFAVSVAIEAGRTPPPRVPSDAGGSPVLVVKGFNSRWDGITYRWVRGDHRIRRFSYRGLGADDEPRTYERSDTHRSVQALAREMRRQVDVLRAATGEDVSIVAESEGALVAQVYLAATPHAPVRALVLLSPLAEPGRVFFPPAGEEGWGVASGVLMRGIASVIGALGPVDVSADEPVFRSMVDLGPTVGALLACPPPGVRSYAVLPIDEGVSAPAPLDVGYDHRVVPAFHGGLLGDDETARAVAAVLDGRAPPDGSSWWSGVGATVGALASPWQAPSLEPSLEPTWRGLPGAGAGAGADDCRAVRAELRRQVGSSKR